MALNLGALALKIPLNWAFMYGKFGLPELGGAGCAAATSTIAWLTCAAAWTWCRIERDYARYQVFARWSWPRLRAQWQLVSLGVPIGATFFVDVTAFTFMALFIARFGALYSGAHQIAANVAALAFMLPLAIGSAAAVLIGQALGAGVPQRARTTGLTALVLGLGCGLAVGTVIFLGAGPIVSLYTSDAAVRELAATLLAFVGVYHVFDAAQAVVVGALRGYRHAFVPMLIFGVALWGVGLGGGYAIGIAGIGVAAPLAASGFWLAGVAGMALAASLVTAYFLRVSRSA
jgi:MATE family multidrug resistance protein